MSQRKVLIVCSGKWFNAVAGYALQSCALLRAHGVDARVAVGPHGRLRKKLEQAGLPAIASFDFSSTNPITAIGNYKRLRTHLLKEGYAACIVMTSDAASYFALFKLFHPGLICIRFRGDDRGPNAHFMNRLIHSRRCIDALLFPSEKARSMYHACMNRSVPESLIPYFSLPMPPAPSNENFRELHGIPADAPVFCLLGRNQPVKGHMELLQAITQKGLEQAYILFLIKDLDEFPEVLQELKSYADQNGLTGRVKFLGHVENLMAALEACDCGVVPSLGSEVICRATTEFFMSAKPVIAFPVGALPEIIVHGRNGYVAEDVSPQALAKCLQAFTALSSEARKEMSHKALVDYQAHYNGDAAWQSLNNLLLKNS